MSRPSRILSVPRFLAKLNNLIQEARPDWDGPGIKAALEQADRERHQVFVIAAASFDAAGDPNTRTPAGITARLRDGWGKSTHGWSKAEIDNAKAPLPHGQPYPRCKACNRQLLAGETRDNHQCSDWTPSSSPTKASAIAEARQALLHQRTVEHERAAAQAAAERA